jgi:hypothetical protein
MWRKLANLAEGAEDLAERYSALPMTGLKVTAYLGKNYAPTIDGAIHLDSLLAYAVMSELWGTPDFNRTSPPIFPVPLQVVYVSDDGLPLVAVSDMKPEFGGTIAISREYWHKRFPVLPVQKLCEKPNTQVRSGSYKEYRVPVKVITAEKISCFCIGNLSEVERLLSSVSFVGKKRSQGKGMVLKWCVENADISLSKILECRAVPIEFSGKKGGVVGGWTSPYWFRPWHRVVA